MAVTTNSIPGREGTKISQARRLAERCSCDDRCKNERDSLKTKKAMVSLTIKTQLEGPGVLISNPCPFSNLDWQSSNGTGSNRRAAVGGPWVTPDHLQGPNRIHNGRLGMQPYSPISAVGENLISFPPSKPPETRSLAHMECGFCPQGRTVLNRS